MQNYTDTYRKKQAQTIRARQLDGMLLAIDDYCADQFPLPVINGIARPGKYGGFETDLGPFQRSTGIPTWEIQARFLPDVALVPLRLASVHAHETGLKVTIDDGTRLSLDEIWTAEKNAYELLTKVNQHLASDHALGATAWELTWEDSFFQNRPRLMRLMNDHVSVVCSSAAWDADGTQLVAATLVSPEQQSLRAITATLATNSKKGLTLSADGVSHYLNNARRGFTAVSGGSFPIGRGGACADHPAPADGQPTGADCRSFLCAGRQRPGSAIRFQRAPGAGHPLANKAGMGRVPAFRGS
ncbi:MAG: hypothetical protein NTW32_21890 [Chloroflexi bacterium]|nr:hypothetical protein [Chloroflexota bacterium]